MVTCHKSNPRVVGIAKSGSACGDLGEHSLCVSRRSRYSRQDLGGRGLLLSRLPKLALGLGEFLGQLLDPVFRGGKIVGGRSCHLRALPMQLGPPPGMAARWKLAAMVAADRRLQSQYQLH